MKFVFVPPQSAPIDGWLTRLQDSVPEFEFVAPETEDEAVREIVNADAAFASCMNRARTSGIGAMCGGRNLSAT